MLRQLSTFLLVLLFATTASAGDWSPTNRIKPGENRSYQFTTLDDSVMLDARACATSLFSWQQDIAGSNAVAEATLYECPTMTSVVANCSPVTELVKDVGGMAVLRKPGFYLLDTTTAPTSSGIARMTAFCSKNLATQENFIVRRTYLDQMTITQGSVFAAAFNPGNRTKGFFIVNFQEFTDTPTVLFLIEHQIFDFARNLCVGDNETTEDSRQLLMMGLTSASGEIDGVVNKSCPRPLSNNMQIRVSVSGALATAEVTAIWYGHPN